MFHIISFLLQIVEFTAVLTRICGKKSFSQSDGRWRYSTNGGEASTYAAGITSVMFHFKKRNKNVIIRYITCAVTSLKSPSCLAYVSLLVP